MTMQVLLIGAGRMGRWHAHGIARAGAELIGFVDPTPDAWARGLPQCADLAAALAQKPDIVHVCSPIAVREAHVRAALGAGAHVVVEKPVAANLAITEQLLAVAAERGLTITPGHQMTQQRWRDQVADIGSVVSVDHVLHSAGAGPDDDADGIAGSILCHPLSVFAELVGPRALAEAEWAVTRTGPGELRGLAAAGSCALQFTISLTARPPCNDLVLAGDRATLHADLFHGFASLDGVGAGRAGKIARPFARAATTLGRAGLNLGRRAMQSEPAYPGLDTLIERTHAALAAHQAPPLSHDHVRAVARARDAILAAR